jgi:putative transposase
MARKPRLALAGQLHHVLLEGHNGQPVFVHPDDRTAYLAMLHEATRSHGVAVHAYALVDTAVHLLATPQEAPSLGRLVQALGRRYVSDFNRRHGRSGTLWNGRFRSSVLQAEAWLLPATIAIETEALRKGLASTAEDWLWSSALHHLGRSRAPCVTEHSLYWRLGNTPFERELAHAHLLRDGISAAVLGQLEGAVRSAGVLGDAAFAADVAQALGRPPANRARGRPRKIRGQILSS